MVGISKTQFWNIHQVKKVYNAHISSQHVTFNSAAHSNSEILYKKSFYDHIILYKFKRKDKKGNRKNTTYCICHNKIITSTGVVWEVDVVYIAMQDGIGY